MAYKRKFSSRRRFKKSRRGRYSRRAGVRKFQSRVKRALLKTTETKYFDVAIENYQLYHNLGYGTLLVPPVNVSSIPDWFNPWLRIQNTGATATQRMGRIGDTIIPRGMSLKIYLANKLDRPNTMIRIIVAILPKDVNGVITTNVFDPFQVANAGTNGNNMIWPADHDVGVKFLYDRVHRIGTQSPDRNFTTGVEMTKVIKLWIKRKRSRAIKFNTTSTAIVNKPLAVYAIPYEQYSTMTTDRVSTIAGMMRMYYKDP